MMRRQRLLNAAGHRRSTSARQGLTLLEVLLSLGLFLGALAALSQLWYGGVRASVQARLATQAILRCESKMNEVVAGAVPLQSTTDAPFEDDSSWTWSLQVQPGPHANVLLLVVNVSHPGQGGLSASGYQLSRLLRDPQVWTDAQQTTSLGATTP
jgi:general secretion pathway protein I